MAHETDEVTVLRARVAQLEAKVTELAAYAGFFEHSLALFAIADATGRVLRLNGAWERTLGWTLAEIYADGFFPLIHPDDIAASTVANQALKEGQPAVAFENRYRCRDGTYRHLQWFATPVDANGTVYTLAQDITEQRLAEERARVFEETRLRAVRQDEVIRAQAAALAELSTPLIPVSDQVVVMPLIGAVDARRAGQVIDTLLAGIADRRADTAILDITGVSGVDAHTADMLLRAARAVRLLGARVMLTGIRPDVARMFVELGVDLQGIQTHGSLQAGITAALDARRG